MLKKKPAGKIFQKKQIDFAMKHHGKHGIFNCDWGNPADQLKEIQEELQNKAVEGISVEVYGTLENIIGRTRIMKGPTEFIDVKGSLKWLLLLPFKNFLKYPARFPKSLLNLPFMNNWLNSTMIGVVGSRLNTRIHILSEDSLELEKILFEKGKVMCSNDFASKLQNTHREEDIAKIKTLLNENYALKIGHFLLFPMNYSGNLGKRSFVFIHEENLDTFDFSTPLDLESFNVAIRGIRMPNDHLFSDNPFNGVVSLQGLKVLNGYLVDSRIDWIDRNSKSKIPITRNGKKDDFLNSSDLDEIDRILTSENTTAPIHHDYKGKVVFQKWNPELNSQNIQLDLYNMIHLHNLLYANKFQYK